jgi:hypothetical protein
VDDKVRADFALGDERAQHLVNVETGEADSLFDKPGLLLLNEDIRFNLIENPQNYDLSAFNA